MSSTEKKQGNFSIGVGHLKVKRVQSAVSNYPHRIILASGRWLTDADDCISNSRQSVCLFIFNSIFYDPVSDRRNRKHQNMLYVTCNNFDLTTVGTQ